MGLDDTDSSEGMCTTFLAYNIARRLVGDKRRNTVFLDYPNLIRHNPNIPWKTRGNASLVLRIKSEYTEEQIFKLCERFLREHSTSDRANSGLVLYSGTKIPEDMRDFSRRALSAVLSVKEAKALAAKHELKILGLRSEQGLVGALAGIGNTLLGDYTFELIAYRKNVSLPRMIDREKIIKMDAESPQTFSNLDRENGRIMIMPHGPDPVLCGIRGESPPAVKSAFELLGPLKNCRGWMIFRSNQGTGEHLREMIRLWNPKAYSSGMVRAEVSSRPRVEQGGHVFLGVRNEEGEIECAFYEPTGPFRKIAQSLLVGDILELAGGIRKSTSKHSKVLNVESITVISKAKNVRYDNPHCPECGKRMSSLGRGQGYSCKCGFKSKSLQKKEIEIERKVEARKLYLPPVRAHRHLTKPLQRYSLREKTFRSMTKEWWSS
ncbi:MAG: TiaS agmantine-binding domain-containing protein [Nitrososphaerales archaeon]